MTSTCRRSRLNECTQGSAARSETCGRHGGCKRRPRSNSLAGAATARYGFCQRYLWERPMDWNLTPTGWSILGFLSLQSRNGYEIRQAARRSVEHFWGVSDGQLYPQLRHLHDAGLVAPRGTAAGRGAATSWRLTPAGRAALHDWLRSP